MQFLDDYIRKVFMEMESKKNLGPDGMNGFFYKCSWDIIGGEVCLAIKYIFQTKRIKGRTNATHLYIIPKPHNPISVIDVRPMACCNVVYKAIVRLVVGRLKDVLHQMVSPTQTTFLPGRNIQDSLMLAHELARGYRRKHDEKRCMVKIDIKGAYDSINWKALDMILLRVEFPTKMIECIKMCVNLVKYSVLVNREVYG